MLSLQPASNGHWRGYVNLINIEVTMDYPNLPKQTFADLIALRQAVVALIIFIFRRHQHPQFFNT
ncbi:hypothetical protein FQX89_16355 [Salmonella enterica]|nr:hypothetical protein [Salmonella enterica]EBH8586953.1 hypothetical protein [Salmonella enterica subsp. enterica serovar Pomona]ECK2349310.1 hypothetical protein [Salmonella enterica]EDV4586241.1 hypothetical protein [Salmonella enterica subsp. enterica]